MSRTTRLTSLFSLFFIFLALSFIYVAFAGIQDSIIIRLDTYHNLTFLGFRSGVLKIAVTGLAIVLFNILLVRIIERKYFFEARILSFGNIIISVLILVVISGIIYLN